MDASKALQALETGDLYSLAEALDWNQTMGMVMPDGERLFAGRIGAVDVGICKDGETGHIVLKAHDHPDAATAEGCFNDKLAGVQEARGRFMALGFTPPTLTVDGVLVPAPDAPASIFDQVAAMLRSQGIVPALLGQAPDDARELDGTI